MIESRNIDEKLLKNKIFLIVMLCIISCGIGVFAANTYKASDILYTSSDGISIYAKKVLSDNDTDSFSFNKIVLNITLNVSIVDTYTSKGSTSTSIKGNITIYSDGTYEKDKFTSDFSGGLLNSTSARYQSKASITINFCDIS